MQVDENNVLESQPKPILYKALLWEILTLLEDRFLWKARVLFLTAKHEIFYKDIKHIDLLRVTVVPAGSGKSLLQIKGKKSALSPCKGNFAIYDTEDQKAMLERLSSTGTTSRFQ